MDMSERGIFVTVKIRDIHYQHPFGPYLLNRFLS